VVPVYVSDVGGQFALRHTTVSVTMLPTAAGTLSQASAGVPFIATVATIADENPDDKAGDFTATIDWADGHQSHGLVTRDSSVPNQFLVLGSTTYARAGIYPVAVEMVRRDGYRLTVSSTVDVAPA